jgi:hypothetical protein
VDGWASRGPRRAVGAARQSTAEDGGRPAQAGYGVRCVRQFAERALVLRGAWRAIFDIPKSDQLVTRPGPPAGASADAGRAVFDIPNFDQLVARIFRYT